MTDPIEGKVETETLKVETDLKADEHHIVAVAERVWMTSDLLIVGFVALMVGLFLGHHFRL